MTLYLDKEYFNWLLHFIGNGNHRNSEYFTLLRYLYNTVFMWTDVYDSNRASDGISLRDQFASESGVIFYGYDRPCSMLEMMVALAIKMELILRGSVKLSKCSQWFWGMVTSLGLEQMNDCEFDELYFQDVMTNFVRRNYNNDGRGGLFRVRNSENIDMRNLEIWDQAMRYIDEIIENW